MVNISKWPQVKAALLEQISRGEFVPGDKLKSERELSDDMGVSRVTLSKALNEMVREGVLERKAGSGTYVAQNAMDFFRSRELRAVGLVPQGMNHPVVMDFIEGIHAEIPVNECDVIIKAPSADSSEIQIVEDLLCRGVDALVVSSSFPYFSEEGAAFYEQVASKVPVVMFDCVVNCGVSSVATDNYEGGRIAASVLSEKLEGGTFWNVKLPSPLSALLERNKGFSEAFAGRSGTWSVRDIMIPRKHNDRWDVFRKAFAEYGIPDGIFLPQDSMLGPLFQAAEKENIDRKKLNACCIDGFSGLPSIFGVPYLEQPVLECGRETAKLIKEMKKQGNGLLSRKIRLAPRLIIPEH
jgi:DNA-binding LacI/PurR family transcriptional regulator